MKTLLFIDNDDHARAMSDLDGVAGDILEDSYGLTKGTYPVEMLADFGSKHEDVATMLFSGKYVLASMSAYTRSPLGTDSAEQIAELLAKAGRNDVEGVVFLDLDSGGVGQNLHRMLKITPYNKHINLLRAIETNFIIGWGSTGLHRVRVNLASRKMVSYTPISVEEVHALMENNI